MNKKIIIILLIIFGTFVSLLFILSSLAPRKTDWDTKYGIKNKAPFGFYILYKELKTITKAKSVHEIKAIEEITKLNPKEDIIFFINENNIYFDRKIINDSIQKFIAKGGTAFISNTSYQPEILHVTTQDSILQNINQFQFNSNYNQYTNEAKYYSEAERNESLATVTFTHETKTNYILIKENNGKIYEHANPDLYTNLYLLSPKGYQYSKEVFKPFQGKNIYWINPNQPYHVNNENSPLSFVLSQPELRFAWYLLLICLFAYLIFKSKREQKQIPLLIPEENLSLEFANVIASMYYENGKPNDIIKKKIDYFFYTIRKQFNSVTENIFDEQFIYILAQKAQITTEETKHILNELQQLYNKKNASKTDVIKTYHIIENYKNKAQIL